MARGPRTSGSNPGRCSPPRDRPGHEFFVIVEGTAKVSRQGRKVAEVGPGASFGELALLDRAPRNATVTAETPMELVVLGQREFAGLIDDVPGFARKLLAGMAAAPARVRRQVGPVATLIHAARYGRRARRRGSFLPCASTCRSRINSS